MIVKLFKPLGILLISSNGMHVLVYLLKLFLYLKEIVVSERSVMPYLN